jgi:ABC-type multidrug transport system fused ATPase/permease subunit
MWQALTWAAADFVHRLPLGLDTPCGEGGGGLSEGQAQRIAIARSLLRDAPILLLDEATSALDPQTEQKVIDNILNHIHDKTVIMVTHRPAAAERCQAVIRL